jgi:hypothetical protein
MPLMTEDETRAMERDLRRLADQNIDALISALVPICADKAEDYRCRDEGEGIAEIFDWYSSKLKKITSFEWMLEKRFV